jgi:hypothetical protein
LGLSQDPSPGWWELQVAAADDLVDWVLLCLATIGFTGDQCRVQRAAPSQGQVNQPPR